MNNTKLLELIKDKWGITIKDLSEEFKAELLEIVVDKTLIRTKRL